MVLRGGRINNFVDFSFTGSNVKDGSQDVKIPLKVLIVASHRTGSSLLGDILSYSRQGYIKRYEIIDSGHKNNLYVF